MKRLSSECLAILLASSLAVAEQIPTDTVTAANSTKTTAAVLSADSAKPDLDSSSAKPREFERPANRRKRLPVIVPFTEILIQDAGVWFYDRYIIDKDYAKIGPSIWKRNFKEGWKWDDNHFAVNFFGHPYQGSYYYTAARSAGYGFYPSFFFTMTGSYFWEMFCEQEYPAPNDLVATTFGGTIYGEIMYRLSQRLLAKPDAGLLDNLGAFIISPFAYLQEWAAGPSSHNPGYAPLQFYVFAGAGKRFGNDYRYKENSSYRSSNSDWNESSGFYGFNLAYGRPDREIRAPFEYFTLDFQQELSHDGMLLHLESLGKLKNINMRTGDNWMDLGSYLHFDTFYSDELVEMNALSLGLGADVNIRLSDLWRFRMIHLPSILLFGATDFNYDGVLAETDPNYEVTRNYQYSIGTSYKAKIELELNNWGRYWSSTAAYLFRTIPNTEPHYGMSGYDAVLFHNAHLEYYLPRNVAIGARWDFYIKISAYSEVEPMSRILQSVGIYLKYGV